MRLVIVLLLGLLLTGDELAAQPDLGFQFVRVRYGESSQESDYRSRWRRQAPWAHDHPTAELNFYEALKRTTRIHVGGSPLVLDLSDDRIFEHSFLYLCEPGYWQMGDQEAENLRRYLRRGGFILFDDFRGRREWAWFEEMMQRVLPDVHAVELPDDHPIWTIYYDIDPVSAPSLVSGGMGPADDRYRAFMDEKGRIIALACYNQDIGDGWEWPDRNFANASTISFQMGINFLIWALTH